MSRGLLIALEGIDGTGKSTVLKNLQKIIKEHPKYGEHFDKFVFTKEPYNYDEVKAKLNAETDPLKALDLLVDDYMHHINELILPAIDDGKIVITDRFIASRYAYQTAMINKTPGNYDSDIAFITSRHPTIIEPDLTILLRCQDETRKYRLGNRNTPEDIENRIDTKIVENVYLKLANENPDTYIIVWAEGCSRCVSTKIFDKIVNLLDKIQFGNDFAG